jgi:hypothetical protein
MRLITRADFDGLVCGAILMEAGVVDSWKFAHPKDLQDGKVDVGPNDVLANVPYVPGCGMWFDHHTSELVAHEDVDVAGARAPAPSAARIVYEYYEGIMKLPHLQEMVDAADRVDSANLTLEEIVKPKGWVLLGFIVDPRTGLGRHRGFTVGNWELMEELMDGCRNFTIDELLMLPNVAERVEVYQRQNIEFHDMLLKYSRTDGPIVITDLRGVVPISAGNRFLLYSLFPETNISIWVADGLTGTAMVAMGHSILNRSSRVNVGELMANYGGGGHEKVGTCQLPNDEVDRSLSEMIYAVKIAEME